MFRLQEILEQKQQKLCKDEEVEAIDQIRLFIARLRRGSQHLCNIGSPARCRLCDASNRSYGLGVDSLITAIETGEKPWRLHKNLLLLMLNSLKAVIH